ncbi:MAG: YdcF family protein [Actinomycetota bacterium]
MSESVRWSWRRVGVVSTVGLCLLGALYVATTFLQVWWASRADDARPVDAIVVLGAAQYDGRPSPVLEARLDAALSLYEEGMAPVIVTTGSNQEGDRFTEGFTGFTYLRDQGVPESDLRIVVDGTNTFEELSATANVLRDEGLGEQVLLVSDPYHALRAVEIAREVGLEAWFSPTDLDSSFRQLVRETAGVSLGRLVGFRRVSNLS